MCWRFLREWRADALVRLGHREREVESRSLPRLAPHPDPTAVCFDDTFGDWQSESGAHALGAFGLPVRIEDVAEVLLRNPGPGVAHREQHSRVLCLGAEADRAAAWRELHRVPDQVRQHLEDAVAIRVYRRKFFCGLVSKRDTTRGGLRLEH